MPGFSCEPGTGKIADQTDVEKPWFPGNELQKCVHIYIYVSWFSMVFGYIPVGFPWFSIFMLVFIVWVYIYVYIYIYKIR